MNALIKYILLTLFLFPLLVGKEAAVLHPGGAVKEINRLQSLDVDSVFNKNVQSDYTAVKKDDVARDVFRKMELVAAKNIKSLIGNQPESLNEHHRINKADIASESSSVGFVRIVFDNDIFDNTDYYYTNGMRIELVADFIKQSPTAKILPGIKGYSYDYQGFSVVQNMYTPVTPESTEINNGDRPFAAYLTMGHFRNAVSVEKGIRLKSEISFGVMGPASLGGKLQSGIHDKEPLGWENQIENDLVIDYSIEIEKLLFGRHGIEIFGGTKARVGTVYNNLSPGFSMRLGNFSPIIKNQISPLTSLFTKKLKYSFFVKTNLSFVFYDATLQGGLFSADPYVLNASQINHFVINASAGLSVYYRNFGLELENFYVSPEFEGAYDFRYGRISLVFGF